MPSHARASGQQPSRPQRHHACVGARLRAMRRYRESFIARERAPTRRLVAVFVDARHARHITQLAPKA
ncbi:hypothetical protein D0A40_03875 [Xanthomonas campestris pv. raphani]|nr:hypothetical protein D0A40_03875 [Xanthomonas campestris pv. raphani]